MPDVRIISRDTIKPCSATPENLRFLQLSLLDQVPNPQARTTLILYYSHNETAGKSNQLKKSLSEILTLFYPLAGRIRLQDDDDDGDALAQYGYVECNDEGAEFYEAQVSGLLSEFLRQLLTEETDPLLPYAASTDVPLAVQLNNFDCGGFAIGVLLSRLVADGVSVFTFIKSWADVTRGRVVVPPRIGFAEILPPRSSLKNRRMHDELPLPSTLPEKETVVVGKRLVFDAAKIALLREKIYSSAALRPTRVEAVSALIWRCMMRCEGKAWLERIPVAVLAVNIRKRMETPLPDHSFGNLVGRAYATCSRVVDDVQKVGYLERQLMEALGKMKGDHLKHALQDDAELGRWKSKFDWGKCGIDVYILISWVGFPIYETDFGWGNPKRFSTGRSIERVAVLTSARIGKEGIEALVFMEEEQMAKLEQDQELLLFASASPDDGEESNRTRLSIRGKL